MTAKKNENASIIGIGVAACAVCCAGPILGVLAAVGLGTAAGLALFGTVAVVIGAVVVAFVVVGRRRRAAVCADRATPDAVPVALTNMRSRS